jgi:hypothetical protein
MEQGGTYEKLTGNNPLSGSDPVNEDGAKLNINYVEMRGLKNLQPAGKPTNRKLYLCVEEIIKPSGENTCIKDSLNFYGFECNEENDIIYKQGLKYINDKHEATKTKYIIYVDYPKIKIDFVNKNYTNVQLKYNGRTAPFKRLEYEELFIMCSNIKEGFNINVVNEAYKYIYDGEHIAPMKEKNKNVDFYYMDSRRNVYIMNEEQNLILIADAINIEKFINSE